MLPAAGFDLTSSQLFWLISVPSLVGATLRFPYTFMVAIFGGRNWTIVSAGLLLIPAVLLGIVVSNPETPFGVLLLVAALGGVGGGNFASSMANITYFFPQKEKGWALGLNAAGGNLGTAVAQFAVPDRRHDRRRRHAQHRTRGVDVDPPDPRRDVGRVALHGQPVVRQGRLRRLRRRAARTAPVAHVAALHRHLRLVHRVRERLPEAHRRSVPGVLLDPGRQAAVSLAFLGALIGSLARPYGGRLADRFGGSRVTVGAFAVMALGALALIQTMALHSFWVFLGCFLLLFAATGVGNGSTYRMIPSIFAARGIATDALPGTPAGIKVQRKSAAALGLISAIGAYGGFLVPQVLNVSQQATGGYTAAFYGFVGAYVVLMIMTVLVYVVPRTSLAGQRI